MSDTDDIISRLADSARKAKLASEKYHDEIMSNLSCVECSETSAKVDELIRFVRDVANEPCREWHCNRCVFCQARGLLHKYGELE